MAEPVPVLVERVRTIAARLPRSYEVVVRGRLKFRVGQIVWLSFSHDQTVIGFSFPKELRDALVEAEPEKYLRPTGSDLRFNWVHARLPALAPDELEELVEDAWATVVPQYVAREYSESRRQE